MPTRKYLKATVTKKDGTTSTKPLKLSEAYRLSRMAQEHDKVVICSQFDEKGKLYMSNKLKKIGITNSVYPNCIYIKNKKLFFEYILNHNYSIPESYKYKF